MSQDSPTFGAGPSRRNADALAARDGPAAAIAVVALALVLRLPGLFEWWVNPDEGIYFAALTQDRFGVFLSEAFATAHPPLYFLALRAMGAISTNLAWLRSLALVCGCAAVWAFIQLGRDIGGPAARGWLTGLVAGLLLAVSPTAIELSQVIRPYMLLVLLLALTLHFLLRYFGRPSRSALLLYAVCASLAALVHYSAALAFAVIAVLVVVDGMLHGTMRAEWRRLVAIQAIPGAGVVALYVLQLRQLMDSTDAEFSVTTWLSGYLIHTPLDVWLTLVGFHASLVGPAAAVSATLVTLVALAVAARNKETELVLAAGGALLVGTACAALELYPFGAGRHSAWLLPFVTPGLAWIAPYGVGGLRQAALLTAVVVGGLLLRAPLGAERVEPALAEHVVRSEHVAAMADVLNPETPPRVVVMSTETYRLLLPLYHRERQRARTSGDGVSMNYMHFRWGTRDVLVLPGLDLSVLPSEIEQPNHLYAGTHRAAAELGVALPQNGEPILVLSGGWRRSLYDLAELARQAGFAGSTQVVPSLVAVTLDLEAYGRTLRDGAAPRDSPRAP